MEYATLFSEIYPRQFIKFPSSWNHGALKENMYMPDGKDYLIPFILDEGPANYKPMVEEEEIEKWTLKRILRWAIPIAILVIILIVLVLVPTMKSMEEGECTKLITGITFPDFNEGINNGVIGKQAAVNITAIAGYASSAPIKLKWQTSDLACDDYDLYDIGIAKIYYIGGGNQAGTNEARELQEVAIPEIKLADDQKRIEVYAHPGVTGSYSVAIQAC